MFLYSYKKLVVWQKADILAKEVYKLTNKFPKHEIFGLTSQLRRAVLSVPLNIIEGYARNNKKEFRNFLRIAYASLVEVEYLIEFVYLQKYITEEEFERIENIRDECGRLLWRFLKSQD
ncbi:four helix bundle protein [Candidatus Woesebacteria bacterium GWB1_43_5]|uniref:Four helix bundle protein n=1 Tax=Candidatus Woesebacteria bacterium GWB1_43_5 TaxID=1802474 RepID=A0A1F7WTD8_9BACT|nr:MAG: four helix bundle protein [Candidatus Woesebacteria bacterium GWB1_43_5]